jgi:hypothetical protein
MKYPFLPLPYHFCQRIDAALIFYHAFTGFAVEILLLDPGIGGF